MNAMPEIQALFVFKNISLSFKRCVQTVWRIDRFAPCLVRCAVVNPCKVYSNHAVFFVFFKRTAHADKSIAD
jgi:hypothetical protein